jgi:hypothetical protein
MSNSHHKGPTPTPIKDGADLLRRIGWHPSDMKQIELYARMSPARKVEQMLRLRNKHIRALRARLRREHPNCSDIELAYMVKEQLEMLLEGPVHV